VPIAEILFNEVKAYSFSNCPCFLSAKGNLSEWEILKGDTIIGYFSAEGDEIPYNKPYAIISLTNNDLYN